MTDGADPPGGLDGLPRVVAEVRDAFEAYEAALLANDVDALNEWFWDDDATIRYGIGDQQHGYAALAAWRRAVEPVPADRAIVRADVVVLGDDVAVVTCEFRNGDEPALARQSQVWARTSNGWRIVHAHVSMLPD